MEENQIHYDIFQSKKIYKYLLFYIVPGITAILLAIAIYVARLHISESILVYMPEIITPNSTTAGRIIAFDETYNNIPIKKVELFLNIDEKTKIKLFSGKSSFDEAVDINFELPIGINEGEYELLIEVETKKGKKSINKKIKISKKYKRYYLYSPPPPKDRPVVKNREIKLANRFIKFLPEGSTLITNMKNIIFVTARDKDFLPDSIELCMKESLPKSLKELPGKIKTNLLGITSFIVYPIQNIVSIKIKDCNSSNGTKEVLLPTSPGQLLLRIHKPLAEIDESYHFGVVSLRSNAPLYCDIYYDGYWYMSTSTRIINGAGKIRLSKLKPGINFIQVYSSIPPLERGVVGRHFYIKREKETDKEALINIIDYLLKQGIEREFIKNLKEKLNEYSGYNVQLISAFLLNYLDKGYYKLPLLVNSKATESAILKTVQYKVRIGIAISFIILGIFVLIILTFFTKERIKLYRLHQKEFKDLEEISSFEKERVYHIYLQSAIVMIVIAIAFVLMAVLVGLMEWY